MVLNQTNVGSVVQILQTIYIIGLTQHCSNSIALAMELLHSCTKPRICYKWSYIYMWWLFEKLEISQTDIWKSGTLQRNPGEKYIGQFEIKILSYHISNSNHKISWSYDCFIFM